MARRRKTTRRRTRRAPSTRRGARRITARRAYSRRRPNPRRAPARRRRNPRPVLQTPAVRYAAWAVGGAAASAYLNSWATTTIETEVAQTGKPATGIAPLLKPMMGDNRMHAGVVGALLTIGLSMLPKVKANTRNNLLALGVGMLTTPVTGFVSTAFQAELGNGNGNGNGNGQQKGQVVVQQQDQLRAPAASKYRSSTHYQNSTAQFLGVPVS